MHAIIEGPAHRPTTLDLAFAFASPGGRGRELVFLALAVVIHGAATFGFRSAAPPAEPPMMVTEIEMPPPPEPEKVLPAPAEEAEAVATARASSTPPPQAARAGALLTVKEDAPPSRDAPVDFVTDPTGSSYGSGVVARGGTAEYGERGATAQGAGSAAVTAAAAASPGDGLVAAANLSRRATLSEANACAGFYPSEADADSGAVTLTLVVRADGVVASSAVLSETPSGQGFGKAARTCLKQKRFDPSMDRAGNPVAAATTIKVSFVR